MLRRAARTTGLRTTGGLATGGLAAGLRIPGGLAPTWPVLQPFGSSVCRLCFPQLPLDHVLVGTGIGVLATRVGPPLGSDHLPLIVDLALPQPGLPQPGSP